MVDVASMRFIGGLTASAFLRKHWQRKPLLVREAVPGFHGLMSREELFALAGRDDVESRLVRRARARWSLTHGPFGRAELRALPSRNWTLLVQGVNLHVAAADVLLRSFAFVPYARLDDVMVSYAAPGGGVGPHIDSYDVFLLQGEGRRRWRLRTRRGPPRDRELDATMPVKILTRFRPDAEYTLAPGDMLYLPPDHAHDGIAVDACTTYSIGFRAPSAQELGTAFLDWLRDSIVLEGRYVDPAPAVASEPARIDNVMRERCSSMLGAIRWNDAIVARFLGCYLTEPKPDVFFEPPSRALKAEAFRLAAARRGVALDLRTQLLYDADGRHGFINGAVFDCRRDAGLIRQLANARRLSAAVLPGSNPTSGAHAALLYRWYCDGYLHLD